jgi:uncharacterized protein (TIGR03437 family)
MKFLTFRFTKIFFILFVFAFMNAKATAQQPAVTWNKIVYPSASIYSIMESGANLIVSTDTGIYISSDNGQSWKASNTGLPGNVAAGKLVRLNNYIFAATSYGIWASVNEGQSWNDANAGILNNQFILKLEVFGSTIFAVTGSITNGVSSNGKIYRSTNFGQSWSESTTGLTTDILSTPSTLRLYMVGTTVFAVTELYIGGGYYRGKIFRSSNLGQSWNDASTGLPENFSYATDFTESSNTIFAVVDQKLYQSTNTGVNWSLTIGPRNVWIVKEIESSGSVIFAAGYRYTEFVGDYKLAAIWASTDGGKTWDRRADFSFFPSGGGFAGLQVLGGNLFCIYDYAGTPSSHSPALLVSTNAGKDFSGIGPGTGCTAGSPCFASYGLLSLVNGRAYVVSNGYYQSNKFYAPAATAVSAANYQITPFANESIVSLFGSGLALTTAVAASVPLPAGLENTSVTITDSAGIEKPAPLFYISPTQINFQIPAGLANGVGTVTVNSYNQIVASGVISIANTSPGLFTVNQTGEGFAAANVQRVKTDGTSIFQPTAQYNSTTNKFTGIPINVSSATDQVYLNLYGTGIRGRSNLTNVKAIVGGVDVPVVYAGAHGSYIGVDQINVLLPSTLAGKGDVEVILTVDAQVANTVKISIQ